MTCFNGSSLAFIFSSCMEAMDLAPPHLHNSSCSSLPYIPLPCLAILFVPTSVVIALW
jgi:hypothetical protein